MYSKELYPSFENKNSYFGIDSISRLEATEQIHKNKALYCFFLDTKDWNGYQKIFSDDAILEISFHGLEKKDSIILRADQIKKHVQNAAGDVITNHHYHTPIIDFTSENTASVVWAMEDMLSFHVTGPAKELHGLDHYFERYHSMVIGLFLIYS